MKQISMLMGMLLCVTICLAQQKLTQTKKTPPKVNLEKFTPPKPKLEPPKVTVTKFDPPKHKKKPAKTGKPKFKPPVIKKDS